MTLPSPILNEDLQASLDRAIVMYQKKGRWHELGMDKLREQGNALLFTGPTGTGKTITAHAIARKLKQTVNSIDFAQIGSNIPGELARSIKKLFEVASVRDNNDNTNLVLLDECDTILVSRSKLGPDALWMLEPINQLLVEIRRFRGLVILCSNMAPDFLDPALQSRILGTYHFEIPDFLTRVKLWSSKYGKKLPKIPKEVLSIVSQYMLTGAEIENSIIEWVSASLIQTPENFNFKELISICSNKAHCKSGYDTRMVISSGDGGKESAKKQEICSIPKVVKDGVYGFANE